MTVAFATGAVAAGLAAAGLVALGVWIVTIITGSGEPWSVAPWLLPVAAGVVAIATYLAERIAYRRTQTRMAAHGEPWAYRER